ncbi:hypothetical protein FRC17_005419 [Serendipita sp. 399]|nr:hypothetical protein FRC17_005419 [Serendipita sp. 399]
MLSSSGTGSARAALVTSSGQLVASHSHATRTWRSASDARIFEQSTIDIFSAICNCVQTVLSRSGVAKEDVKGIGFDATCSLAVVKMSGDEDSPGGVPVCVTQGERCGMRGERNIILWADHRADQEAELINQTGSIVLDYVGGAMSLEMEIPKILWLKKHMSPELFSECIFFDLPDYLTYLTTGSLARSSCSLVCKCSYIPSGATSAAQGWNDEFFKTIGLESMVQNGYQQIGGVLGVGHRTSLVLTAGMPVGKGLTTWASEKMGLCPGTPVGSAVIDAYAGWIGTIAARHSSLSGVELNTGSDNSGLSPSPSIEESQTRLAAVAGTSTCYLIQSPDGKFVPGIWGPYKNALFAGWWMNEAGQSSTGQLIEHMLTTHPAYSEAQDLARATQTTVHEVLSERMQRLQDEAGVSSPTILTKDLHMYPDLHGTPQQLIQCILTPAKGNRSPLSDSSMRGSISGLSLDSSLSDLTMKFNVTLEAIALQTRHILDEMKTHGHDIRVIYISGGQAKNRLLVQLLADVCQIPVILPNNYEVSVVLGAAMLGRFASEVCQAKESGGWEGFASQEEVDLESGILGRKLWDIMVEMTQVGQIVPPAAAAGDLKLFDAKYKIFRETIDIQRRWRAMMQDATR